MIIKRMNTNDERTFESQVKKKNKSKLTDTTNKPNKINGILIGYAFLIL